MSAGVEESSKAVHSALRRSMERLNDAQRSAVEAPCGPLLIFAGAGSGKTNVIAHRIAYLILEGGADSHQVCAVTFTKKAATEMRSRIGLLVGNEVEGIWCGTFHSLGAYILRTRGHVAGISSSFSIYDEADRLAAVKRAMEVAGIANNKMYSPQTVIHSISTAKNAFLTPSAAEAIAHSSYDRTHAAVYAAYQSELERARALDFDDLLCQAVVLLEQHDEVTAELGERFQHLFVDEYQDTNHAQYRLATLIAQLHRDITVVGDDDQSIYGWRGADITNILSFKRDYPDATVVTLDRNYRSTQTILDAAYGVIEHVDERAEKRLWTDIGSGEPITIYSTYDERDEAERVSREIVRLVRQEHVPLNECVVTYRTNAQSRAFEDAFRRNNIPYRMVGGIRYYERKEVKDILAYCKFVVNPADVASFVRIANVPKRKLGEKSVADIVVYARDHALTPLDAMRALLETPPSHFPHVSVTQFVEIIDSCLERLASLPPSELLKHLTAATRYEQYLRDGTEEGEDRWNNVTELIGLATEYDSLPPEEGMQTLLENLALASDVDMMSGEGDAVTLITLHQVKGLEYQVVFLVGWEEGLLPHVRAIREGTPSDLDEERRLAYVGITRAKEHLYISHAFVRHLYGEANRCQPSRFLDDIPEELMVRQQSQLDSAPQEERWGESQNVPPSSFAVGDRVRHHLYGVGTVVQKDPSRGGDELTIRFDSNTTRIFIAQEARLERL